MLFRSVSQSRYTSNFCGILIAVNICKHCSSSGFLHVAPFYSCSIPLDFFLKKYNSISSPEIDNNSIDLEISGCFQIVLLFNFSEIDPVEEHNDSLEDTLDKKVSSDVTYDWDYLDRMEERGEMPLEELMSLYKNLYT